MELKEAREAEGMKFFNRLSDVMDTSEDMAVGDMVAFTNDTDTVFGPYEVFAFGIPDDWDRCVYINYDAYWFPVHHEQLTILRKGGI